MKRAGSGAEKVRAAATSVLASLVLTILKAVVGLATGSLGLVSEAAHSGLDCVATVVSWWSVRASAAEPDREHHYGHGKLEHLSALVQSGLLLITCGWIISEAVGRLFLRQRLVEATFWSFGVIILSIVVDAWRSRALKRAAVKYGSQALEADALHFSTDIWSSAAVLAGLVVVRTGQQIGYQQQLSKADAGAALFVAGVMAYVSVRMAKRAGDFLVDRAPAGIGQQVDGLIRRVSGVVDIQQLRIRQSGSGLFIDTTILADPGYTLQEADALASAAERAVTEHLPKADIIIHVEPADRAAGSVAQMVRDLADGMGLRVHAIRAREVGGRLYISMHVELPARANLQEVHSRLSELEKRVGARLGNVAEIETHPEPAEC